MSNQAATLSWKQGNGWLQARSSVMVMAALLVSFSLAYVFNVFEPGPRPENLWPDLSANIPAPRIGTWQPEDQQAAQIAWKYFENNYQAKTGLVNSTDNYPAATMWDTGSYFMALISAERLQIIGEDEFNARVTLGLASLASLPLYDGQLPNKSYNTTNLAMVDYNNQATPRGIGWSAIDIGRLLVSFNILAWQYPAHTAEVRKVIDHWDLGHVVTRGQLTGSTVGPDNKTAYVQEGRLGYEEYSAKSFSLIALDVTTALHYQTFLHYVDIDSVKVPTDSRSPEKYHAPNYVVSEPYILDGLEYGWDSFSREFAYHVYAAQQARYQRTKVLTAVSEDNIDQAPYFVYNTVFTNGKAWNAITDTGVDASRFKTLSTKAVFGWYALYGAPYTSTLRHAVKDDNDPARGWYAGIYEATGKPNKAITANTNSIILESLCFQRFGPLMRIH